MASVISNKGTLSERAVSFGLQFVRLEHRFQDLFGGSGNSKDGDSGE